VNRFAVRAGAKHVYATDVSNMIDNARKIAGMNGMSDKITFVKGRVEDAKLPQIDIIVSEWMGFCLLSEIMLDCLLQARDKYLVPGGLMFPDRTALYVAAIEDAERYSMKVDCKYDSWSHAFGLRSADHIYLMNRLERCLWARLQLCETSGYQQGVSENP
jgi:hypothetical protein